MTLWSRIRSTTPGQPDDATPRETQGPGEIDAVNGAEQDPEAVIGAARAAEWRDGPDAAAKILDAARPERDAALVAERALVAFRADDVDGLRSRAALLATDDPRLACDLAEALLGAGAAEIAVATLARPLGAAPDETTLACLKLCLDVARARGLAVDPRQALGAAAARPEVAALLDADRAEAPTAPGLKPALKEALKALGAGRLGDLADDRLDALAARAEASGDLRALAESALARRLPRLAGAALDRLVASGGAEPADFIAAAKAARRAEGEDDGRGQAERLAWLDRGVEALGAPLELLVERARCLMALGAPLLARQDAARAHALDPASPYATARYADALWRCGLRLEARDLLARHLEREPDDLELGHKWAQFSYWDRDVEPAEAWLRKAHAAGRRSEAIDFLHVSLLVWLNRYAEAESVAAEAIAAYPSERLKILYVSIALHIVWPTLPDYADPIRVTQLEQAFAGADLDALDGDLIWNIMTVLSVLKRRESVHGMLDRALASTFRRPERPQRFWAYVARTLAREETDDSLPRDPAALARALTDCGLAHVATGGAFWAPIAFRIALALNADEKAAAFNAGFVALSAGETGAAATAFRDLDRIYREDMERVAWPRRGQAMWPWRSFDIGQAFEREKPEGAQWPRITVVTPSFNQGGFIEETILSILNQDYPNLEYIVVDAVSTDGTADVLERYRGLIDRLIVEPDRGQTDAINKGLRLATGELVTWVNSDDMLAPGALFALALARLSSRADLIFGMCLAHRDYRFEIANLPAVRQETFDLTHMARIFRFWLKGFFFYQPEVIFTRELFERAGGALDESLHYTMDYEFWLRCAKASPKVAEARWPIAFFRHHEAQKTSNMLDCVLEQAQVRDRIVTVSPDAARTAKIRERLRAALSKPRPRVALVSARLDKVFSHATPAALAARFAAKGIDLDFVASAAALGPGYDLLIKLVHLQYDADDVRAFRERNPDAATIGWFWDSHHHLDENFGVVEALDLVVPGHAFASSYLASDEALLGSTVPLCVSQWSQDEAERWADAVAAPSRSDALYGGFVRYAFSARRNALIEGLIADGAPGVSFLEEHRLRDYFGRLPDERFREWAGHKASLCLPLARDLSQRFFDALLTGQVPVVAPDMPDLDLVVPPDRQAALGVVRFADYSVEAVRAAHAEALRRFDEGGVEGALARHRFARENHMLASRIDRIVEIARESAAG